tara:strand:- start:1427 stop:2497 length:1071 start_codon:yes stop_codon:yes gene_type:complete
MLKILRFILLFPALCLFYLLVWPVEIDPVAWDSPIPPAMEGSFAKNNFLKDVEILGLNDGIGPEDVAIDDSGNMYAGYDDGRIIKYDKTGNRMGIFVETNGRPLGMRFDLDGNLIVADAIRGLIKVDMQGTLTVLSTKSDDGIPLGFTDDLDIANDGKIYFSDASTRYGIGEDRLDLMEHRPNGRLVVYNPETKQTTTLLDSLYFANGVAMSPDGAFVLFNETYMYRVQKYWIKGEKAGTSEIVIDNLPGFPDNISSNGKGIYWIALFTVRNLVVDSTADKPFFRKMILRMPESMQPQPEPYGFALGIDGDGNVIYNLQDSSHDAYSPITSVKEKNKVLYFGSLTYPGFARINAPE